ncbi:hypothetical protein [Lysobacter gummosus]
MLAQLLRAHRLQVFVHRHRLAVAHLDASLRPVALIPCVPRMSAA